MALKNLSIEIKALKAHLGGAGAGSRMFTGDAGKEDGVWRTTENGKKIFISGGKITKGPKALVGKNAGEGGGGKDLTVVDKKLYDDFISKGR